MGGIGEEKGGCMNVITITLLFLQTINILTNDMETGTQGSIDGYLISIYTGIILSVAIIIIQIFKRNNHSIISKIIYLLLLAFGLLLYIINFKFLYYVTIRGYAVNDVITNAIDYGLAVISNDNGVEKFYPIIVYLIISINVIVCFINIRTKNKVEMVTV
jgi:hypothetical protein